MNNARRNFLKESALVSFGFLGLNNFAVNAATSAMSTHAFGYGPLVHRDNDILSLPEGFSCKVISTAGRIMDDGLVCPGAFDGMGAFSVKKGQVILVRNHELTPGSANGPYQPDLSLLEKVDRNKIYDFGGGSKTCVGGTSTLICNEETLEMEGEYLSLTGTIRNCAGGITPWNTWITCEETNSLTGGEDGVLEKDHGYNFEVKATDKVSLQNPEPLRAMGRFIHEAVTVHPATGIVYQTEDTGDSLFYRFIPNEKGNLAKGGKLQCLALTEWDKADTRNWTTLTTETFPVRKKFSVRWIDLDDVESRENDLRLRGYEMGAARFARGEGIWFGKNELYFACTNGGKNSGGQIFRYIPSKFEGKAGEKQNPATLELFIEPNDNGIFQYCDNLTIAPWGDVIICEDKHDPRIIGITAQGKSYVLAQNIGYPKSEFAGPVFSPSGKTLFINIYSPGLTLAITGPWKKIPGSLM